MYLERLVLQNYRCFEHTEIPLNRNLTLFVGENGSGKSAAMSAAAIAAGTFLLGIPNVCSGNITERDAYIKPQMGAPAPDRRLYPVIITAHGQLGGRNGEWTRSLNSPGGRTTCGGTRFVSDMAKDMRRRLDEGDRSLVLPIIAFYGSGRSWDSRREKSKAPLDTSSRLNGYMDCLGSSSPMKLMKRWFRAKEGELFDAGQRDRRFIPELDAVCSAIEDCFVAISGAEDAKFVYNRKRNELDIYSGSKDGGHRRIPFGCLGDGLKTALGLVVDMACRMAILNPQLGSALLQETPGVVAIDEIDLHLHPSWQSRILDDLRTMFPKVQFITNTHSPAVVNSVRSENVVVLDKGRAWKLDDEVYGKDTSSVLREVMGAWSRPKAICELFERFGEEMDNGNLDGAASILNKIEERIGSKDAEAAACWTRLELEKWRRERGAARTAKR